MAKRMKFTDVRGISLSDSYWRVTNCTLSPELREADITFRGYRDAQARQASLGHVGEKKYVVKDDAFDAAFSNQKVQEAVAQGKNVIQMCYEYATACNDVNGSSFFAAAQDC